MHHPIPTRCLIFDLDTTLPFPTYFHKYVTETFRSDMALRPEHYRWDYIVIHVCSLWKQQKWLQKKRIHHVSQNDARIFLLWSTVCNWSFTTKLTWNNSLSFSILFFVYHCFLVDECRCFRVIPAEQYLASFSSDRRHMRRPDGTWIKPPPPYPSIQPGGKLKTGFFFVENRNDLSMKMAFSPDNWKEILSQRKMSWHREKEGNKCTQNWKKLRNLNWGYFFRNFC